MVDTQVADTIFYGGDIITMDDQSPCSGKIEAIAITNGIIVAVGSLETAFSLKGPQTEVIFLNQQTLMPGFIEPHQHAVLSIHMKCTYTYIGGLNYKCYAEVHEVMKSTIQAVIDDPAVEDKWVLFFAWDPDLIPDLPTLSATFLDENFSTDVAIGLLGQSGHVAWVNSLALSKAGITATVDDTTDGIFVKDKNNGSLTGLVLGWPAISGVLNHAPPPGREKIINNVVEQWKYYASVGITTITELAYSPNERMDQILKSIAARDDCPIRLGLYQERLHLATSSKLPIAQRESATTKATESTTEGDDDESIGYFNDKLWEIGIKLFADGSPNCGTAAVREPFLNTPLTETLGFPPAPNYGILNFTSEDFFATITKLTQEGKQVAVHCQGERACEQILKVYEQVLTEDPTNTCRHRMEHIGLMTVDQIARAGKINIALSFFVDKLRFYGSVYRTDIFGEERVNRWTPLSEATKSGVTWTIHQDHPSQPGDACPFSNMKTAITRTCRDDPSHVYGPEYRVSIDEALKSYTVNAAWQLHLDKQLGSITVGKKADLVVLSDNPYHKDPFHLEDIKVVETFIEGRRNNVANLTTVAGLQEKVLQLTADK